MRSNAPAPKFFSAKARCPISALPRIIAAMALPGSLEHAHRRSHRSTATVLDLHLFGASQLPCPTNEAHDGPAQGRAHDGEVFECADERMRLRTLLDRPFAAVVILAPQLGTSLHHPDGRGEPQNESVNEGEIVFGAVRAHLLVELVRILGREH